MAANIKERGNEIGYLLMEAQKATYEAILPKNSSLNLITPVDLTSNLEETQTTEEHAQHYQKDALSELWKTL